jgi:hypothetical protein
MHRHTELSLVDKFQWVSTPHYFKNKWQNAAPLWCIPQVGPPSLHYCYAIVLRSCIVLPLSATLQTMSNTVANLQDNQTVFRIFIALLRFSFDFPSYITITKLNTHNNKKLTNLWSSGRAPSLQVIPWHLPYNWGKSKENLSQGSNTYSTSRHSTIQEQWTVQYVEEKQ